TLAFNRYASRPRERAERRLKLRAYLRRFDCARNRQDERAPAVTLIVEAAHVCDRKRAHACDEPFACVLIERIIGIEDELREPFISARACVRLFLAYGRDGLLFQLL